MTIVITGIGCVSALGTGVEEHLTAFRNKKDGLGDVTLFRSKLRVPVGEVKKSDSELKNILGINQNRVFSRTALLGMLAAEEAFLDSGISTDNLRVGLISASSVGGMDLTERFFSEYIVDNRKGRLCNVVHHDIGDHTENIAGYLSLGGFRTSVSTACSSASNAVILGARMIEQGKLDAVIVGGADSLCKFTLNGFNSLMILDGSPCRPFDESRSGLNLGEGAGYLVLQSEKTVKDKEVIYCKLAGFANANDAYHQTASSPDGEGAFLAMSNALRKAVLQPSEIDYINAHGTGTDNNDLSESAAIKRLFGEKPPLFSSTKTFTGHTLGASGGLEAVFSVLSIRRRVIYPNLRFLQPITETGLVPVTEMFENQPVGTVLSNSFGFGGNNTTLIFQQYYGLR